MGPDCGIEGLIRALLQRDGLGHLASGLFPICKCKFPDAGIMLYHVCLCTLLHLCIGRSNPPSVWNIFQRLGDTWAEFALYLGYTKEQVASITKQSPHNVDLQIRLFLREFQLPDMDCKTKSILVRAIQNAIKYEYDGKCVGLLL